MSPWPLARRLLAAGLAGWAGCCPAAEPPPSPRVLLIAVGDEQPVFDRFVADLSRRFETLDAASVVTASSSGKVGQRLDAPGDVYAAIGALREPRPGEGAPSGCLVYLTGHGTRAGLSMPLDAASAPANDARRRYAALRPRELDAALRRGCGDAPTVVVASGCYSGVYLGRPGGSLRGARRVVLTAAAPDRASFGCGDDQIHTYYDGCFLRALDEALASSSATWRGLAGRAATCVAERERALGRDGLPSRPQSFFGGGASELPLPLPRPR